MFRDDARPLGTILEFFNVQKIRWPIIKLLTSFSLCVFSPSFSCLCSRLANFPSHYCATLISLGVTRQRGNSFVQHMFERESHFTASAGNWIVIVCWKRGVCDGLYTAYLYTVYNHIYLFIYLYIYWQPLINWIAASVFVALPFN